MTVEYAPRKRPDIENPGHDPRQTHSAINKQDYPDSEMDDWDWDLLEASPLKGTTTATQRLTALPPLTVNHEVEEGNRQDDHSDHEVDTLNWDVLEHTPDTDTKTKLDNTSQLLSSLTCERKQEQWLLCQDTCGYKKSLPNLDEKTRIIQDYGLHSGIADLISNTHRANRASSKATKLFLRK